MVEHIDGIAGVREARVETLGQGDALIVIDAEDELINDIDEMVLENLAAGCSPRGAPQGFRGLPLAQVRLTFHSD